MDKGDELLLLIALSGELPADWIGRSVGSDSYGAALLTRLKEDGMIKLRKRDGIRGYLLREKGKKYLMEKYQEDVEMFISGSSCTNHVKSEPSRRLRLHRMSMVWIFCRRAGVKIFCSEKPKLFNRKWRETSYYGTNEWKLKTDQEIKGSRACGLLIQDKAYVVYNTLDCRMKWQKKTERNLSARMTIRLRKMANVTLQGAILMGTGEEMIKTLLYSDGGLKGNLFQLDDVYEEYYYVPLCSEANLQFLLLCSREGNERLKSFLRQGLRQDSQLKGHLEEGIDRNGKPVYFCYLMGLWKLKRILERPIPKPGRIFCFSYQARELREIAPESFSVEAILPEKAAQYLGWN